MQFELSTCQHDAADIAGAMRTLDARAPVVSDVAHARLEVRPGATAAQMRGKLQYLGYVAWLLGQPVHVGGGSTCWGQCG
jgi:hypothetical protein